MQTIIVDMTPGFRMPTIYYSQGDIGTQFAVDLRSRFGDSLPAGATVTIQATKPSGFGFSEAATSVTNGVAVFTTVAGMTDEAGRFAAELKVQASGVTLFTANFYMNGEATTHPEGTIDGSEETVIPELTQLVERAEEAASSVLDRQTVTNTLPAGSQATYSFDEDTNTQTFGIPQGEAGAGAAGVTASAYSSSKTYAVGDYVIHNSNLYRCTTAITTAESFTAAHWTQVVLADDVSDLKAEISDITVGNPALGAFVKNSYVNKNDGSFASAGSWSRTDYVAVNLFDNITAKSSASSAYNAIYDKSKAFISAFTVGTTDTLIELPPNAYYVAFSNTNAGMASLDVSGVLKSSLEIKQINDVLVQDLGATHFDGNIGTYNVLKQIGTFDAVKDHTYIVTATMDNAASASVYLNVMLGSDAVVSATIPSGSLVGTVTFTADANNTYIVSMNPTVSMDNDVHIVVVDKNGVVSTVKNEVTNMFGTGFIYPVTADSGSFKVKVAEYSVIYYITADGIQRIKAITANTEYTLSPYTALIIDALDNTIKQVSSDNVKPWHAVLLQTGAYDNNAQRYLTGFFANRITVESEYENILLHNVNPDYVRNIDDVITEIVNDNPCDFSAIIGTDMHIPTPTPYSTNRPILNVINRVQSRIRADALLNLGDNVNMGKEDTDEAYYSSQQVTGEIDDHNNAYFVVGNHDYNNISGVDYYRQKKAWIIPDDAIYRMYGRLHKNDVVWGSKDKVYYYKDFEDKKIRMIVLNTLDKPNDTVTIDGIEYEKYPWIPNIVSSAQVDWLIDVALDFSDKSDKANWSVLILSHVTPAPNVEWNEASLGSSSNTNPQGEQIIKIAEAFIAGTSKSLSYTDTIYGGSATLNRNADFTAQGAIPIIGWLSGHCHIDTKTTINGVTYVTTVAGYPDASIGNSQSMSGMEMIEGTYSAFGVDVLSLDKTARKVKLHRIGIGDDREWTY